MKFFKHILLGSCLLVSLNGHAWNVWNKINCTDRTETIQKIASVTGLIVGFAAGYFARTNTYSALASIGIGAGVGVFTCNVTKVALACAHLPSAIRQAVQQHKRPIAAAQPAPAITISTSYPQLEYIPALPAETHSAPTKPLSQEKKRAQWAPHDWVHYYYETLSEKQDDESSSESDDETYFEATGPDALDASSSDSEASDDEYQDAVELN